MAFGMSLLRGIQALEKILMHWPKTIRKRDTEQECQVIIPSGFFHQTVSIDRRSNVFQLTSKLCYQNKSASMNQSSSVKTNGQKKKGYCK